MEKLVEKIDELIKFMENQEVRKALVEQAEGLICTQKGKHLDFIKSRLTMKYNEARKNGDERIIRAVESCPYPMVNMEK